MLTVETIDGEVIRLLKKHTTTKPASKDDIWPGHYQYIKNEDIVFAHRKHEGRINIFAHNFAFRGSITHDRFIIRGLFGIQRDTYNSDGYAIDTYAIGCKRFSRSAFYTILRNAGAIRKRTVKTRAAKAGR